jgi:cell division protein FtsB
MLEPFLIHAQVSKLLEQIAWLRKEYTRLKEENIRLKAQLELLKNLMK